uniref:Basic helix-loop-helix family, member e41 n=1 Tax=Neogobius melanostomus TaxID=47308 RepID=A0A8C6WHC0_9GOBI
MPLIPGVTRRRAGAPPDISSPWCFHLAQKNSKLNKVKCASVFATPVDREKRRDRINECIGQLKDLLPEHLKLSTLGHLEKAVVLELTLKHLNALTATGFQACAKEVLQYLSQFENWTTREQRCLELINHLHKVLAQLQSGAPPLQHQLLSSGDAQQDSQKPSDGHANCVPVIQRTQGGELNENDTDTDSGYGGEHLFHIECNCAQQIMFVYILYDDLYSARPSALFCFVPLSSYHGSPSLTLRSSFL